MPTFNDIVTKLKEWKEIVVITVCVLGWIIAISYARGVTSGDAGHEVKRVDTLEKKVGELVIERDRLIRIETLMEAMSSRVKRIEDFLIPKPPDTNSTSAQP